MMLHLQKHFALAASATSNPKLWCFSKVLGQRYPMGKLMVTSHPFLAALWGVLPSPKELRVVQKKLRGEEGH